MACNKRGAPTSDCNEAPNVDNKAPIKIIAGCGQEMSVT